VVSNHNNELSEGFKMTELGSIPMEWEVVRATDYCSFDRGTEPGSSSYNRLRKGIPFIRVGNIAAQMQELVYTTSADIKLCAMKDILMTFDGSLGVVTRGFEGAYSSGIRKVTPLNNNLDKNYLYFVLQMNVVREVIEKHAVGVTIKHASKAIPHIKIPLPPLPEQKAIDRVLSTIQKAIEAQDKIIAAARELKKSLMHHLFTYGPVTVAEAEKVPLKETEIGLVPEYWDVVRLGEVIDKPEYGYTASASSEMMGPKFLRITDIQNSGVDWVSVPYCACSPVEEGKYKLQSGDILFARIGATTGKTYLIKDGPPAIFASYLIRVRCKSSLLPDYLGQFTTTDQYWNQINASKGGRLKQGINIPVLKSLLVPFPSLPEQQEIALMLSSVDKKIEAEENRKAALQDLFKTMLHLLMTGKIRVKDLEAKLA